MTTKSSDVVDLPAVDAKKAGPITQALRLRRSVRCYRPASLPLAEASSLLWAAQGVTGTGGERTAPSAGALYPLDVYLAAGSVSGLTPGLYRYEPGHHQLRRTGDKDLREALARAAVRQAWLRDAAAIVIFTAVYARTTGKYGRRGIRYVLMEVGHAAQNLLLQAAACGVGAVPVGAFEDDAVAGILDLPSVQRPLLMIPLGVQ